MSSSPLPAAVPALLRPLTDFLAALRFFTRLPVPAWVGHSPDQDRRLVAHLPWVGLLVGGLGAGLTLLLAKGLPVTLALVLGMAATIRLTGAFHEDGFADVCDGFGGGWTRERVLEIMKDSRLGSFGVIGLVLLLLLKWNALLLLAGRDASLLFWGLVGAHSLSRGAAVALMASLPYARKDDTQKSAGVAVRPSLAGLVWAALGACWPWYFLPGSAFPLALGGLALLTFWWARLFRRRLGGYTGDCLGAVQQTGEILCYLVLLCHFG